MYSLKQQPSDFVVREMSNVEIKDKGRFLYLRLRKINRNTLDVVKELAKQLGIGEKKVGFAGSKDKHAVTEQVISLSGIGLEKIKKIKVDNADLEFVGCGDKPVSLGDLKGNEFEIVVRNLDKFSAEEISFVENYFDEQRFSQNNVEIGRHLIKKEFGEAVELIDDDGVKGHLEKHQNDFIGALKKLPIRLLRMYVNAYQSYLWNETVAEYLKSKEIVKELDYSLGKLVFAAEKEDLEIPLIGFATDDFGLNGKIKAIIEKIMKKENIGSTDFVIKQIPELSLEGELRNVFVPVTGLKVGKTEDDELNPGKKKVKIFFSLPKGSYATIVVKRIVTCV